MCYTIFLLGRLNKLLIYFIPEEETMKIRVSLPFIILISVVLLVGMACGTSTNTTGTNNTGNNPLPTNKSGNASSGGTAVNNIQDLQKATIQIESVGTFVDPQEGVVLNGAGRGSGFIIDPSGIAVTNNHVVTGSALIKVWVNGETQPRSAQILGVSECSDLAVIKIDGSGFSYLNWYDQTPQVGLEVYTAGFPLGQPEFNLTKGIISKLKADGQTSWASLDHVLSHDATINPGNSGGPLVTSEARVVGINYAGLKSAAQYFAIDAATAQPIVDKLKTGVDIDSIGINGTAFITSDGKLSGIWVSSVKSGSPADKTGLKGGDILLQMEGLVLATDGTMKDYCSILRTHKSSDTLSVKVFRYSTGETLEGELNGPALVVTEAGSGNNPSATQGANTTTTGKDFFTEEFDGDLSNWSYIVSSGNEKKLTITTDTKNGGRLTTRLDDPKLAVYFYYKPYTYTDSTLTLTYVNRGRNSNNVNIVCRRSDAGWYEFTVQNDGLWQIWAHDDTGGTGYTSLADGGAKNINVKGTNVITASCIGNDLTLYINGVEVQTFSETHFYLTEGQVGFGVNISPSNPVTPVIVDFESFDIQ
jgi:S1-C subfamily serine protease